MPITITEERPDTPDATTLIAELDALLAPLYAAQSRHGYSVQKLLDQGVHFFVARVDTTPAACAGLLCVPDAPTPYAELKRMYVRPPFRNQGLAKALLNHLTTHALTHNLPLLRLETGIHQREAINLYQRAGFTPIPPIGPYHADPVSLCYEKRAT